MKDYRPFQMLESFPHTECLLNGAEGLVMRPPQKDPEESPDRGCEEVWEKCVFWFKVRDQTLSM